MPTCALITELLRFSRDETRQFLALRWPGDGSGTPGDLAAQLEVAPNTLSFHLKELSHAGLISQERQGRNLIYRAAFDTMNALLAYLTENCCEGQGCAPADAAASCHC